MTSDSVLNEFPFVKTLLKREKGALARLWEHLEEIAAVEQREGKLIQVSFAADLLACSRQRVHQLMEAGQLMRVDVNGHPFVTVRSVAEYCQTSRSPGRRIKIPTGVAALKSALRMAHETVEYLERKTS